MKPLCELCGEPLPDGEGMFRLHGYSGPCPKPPMPKNPEKEAAYKDLRIAALEADLAAKEAECERLRMDAERYLWLYSKYEGADFRYGEDGRSVLTFTWPHAVMASLDAAIDAARREGK